MSEVTKPVAAAVDNMSDEELREELRDHMALPGYWGLRPDVSSWSRAWLETAVVDIRRVMSRTAKTPAALSSAMVLVESGELTARPIVVAGVRAFNTQEEIDQLTSYPGEDE